MLHEVAARKAINLTDEFAQTGNLPEEFKKSFLNSGPIDFSIDLVETMVVCKNHMKHQKDLIEEVDQRITQIYEYFTELATSKSQDFTFKHLNYLILQVEFNKAEFFVSEKTQKFFEEYITANMAEMSQDMVIRLPALIRALQLNEQLSTSVI